MRQFKTLGRDFFNVSMSKTLLEKVKTMEVTSCTSELRQMVYFQFQELDMLDQWQWDIIEKVLSGYPDLHSW